MPDSQESVDTVEELVRAFSVAKACADCQGTFENFLRCRQVSLYVFELLSLFVVVLPRYVLESAVVIDLLEDWIFPNPHVLLASCLRRCRGFNDEDLFVVLIDVFTDVSANFVFQISSENVIKFGDNH